jgi:hypothetical protein
MDDMPAFRGFAPNKPIYPFATCSHSDSQVTLSFKPIPANRPTDVALDSQVCFFPFVLSPESFTFSALHKKSSCYSSGNMDTKMKQEGPPRYYTDWSKEYMSDSFQVDPVRAGLLCTSVISSIAHYPLETRQRKGA